jgi:hypothetical protein
MEREDPSNPTPYSESELPHRVKLRMEKAEPKWTKSNVDKVLPSFNIE